MLLGLTVEEISKKDIDIDAFAGGASVSYVDGKTIREKIKNKFGDHSNLFNNSFSIEVNSSHEIMYPAGKLYYDKGNDKLFIVTLGGGIFTPSYYMTEIINEKEENNEYKIEFVEGTFTCEEFANCNKFNLTKNSDSIDIIDVYHNSDISDIDENFKVEYKNILRKNQDKLNKYQVIFEKTSSGYKYKSINEI